METGDNLSPFAGRVIRLIQEIPPGKVATYGQIAFMAGSPRGARQVARILHSCTRKHNLPWHRIVGSAGKISLSPDAGGELQQNRLTDEGIDFTLNGTIDLEKYLWKGADK